MIRKDRLLILTRNILDALYNEIMDNEEYFKTLEDGVGMSWNEIKELDGDIYRLIVEDRYGIK